MLRDLLVTRFFFWNFRPPREIEDPAAIVARTALHHEADLILLTESTVPPGLVLNELNREETRFHYAAGPNQRFQIFTRFKASFLDRFEDHPRMTVRRLRLPGMMEILTAVIHFPERRNHSPSEQRSLCFELAQFLRDAEQKARHRRTILVGDFNMNPFDEGMVDANGFGAMMTKGLTRQAVDSNLDERPRFYNPMWSRLGDMSEGPPGTYYHRQRGRTNIYWHTLDQVLIRPELLDAFIGPSLQVLEKGLSASGEIALQRETKRHSKLLVSDHLPILFTVDLPQDTRHEQAS